MNRRAATALRVAVPLLALAFLAGCSSAPDTLADSYKNSSSGDYASKDGSVLTIGPAGRDAAIAFSGTTDAGSTVSGSSLAGRVVVLNFWYASCPPCREEAAKLEKLNQQFTSNAVTFLGVNTLDTAATARTFEKAHGVTYPSLLDAQDNSVLSAFSKSVPPNATPVTLVLDKQGRVAARFSGLITSPSVVADVVTNLLAEGS